MKTIFGLILACSVALGLAQPVAKAECRSHLEITYCLAGSGQQLEHTTRTPPGFVTVLFAEEAVVGGRRQADFAGRLEEGSSITFRGGVVLVVPKGIAGVFEAQARLYADAPESQQRLIVCARARTGDTCGAKESELAFQTWSVAIWITLPHEESPAYSINFRPRRTRVDAELYTLPGTAYTKRCSCEPGYEAPSIWILLRQRALARFR